MTNSQTAAIKSMPESVAAQCAVKVAAELCVRADVTHRAAMAALQTVMAYHTGRTDAFALEAARVAAERASMLRTLTRAQRNALSAVAACCQIDGRRAALEAAQHAC